MKTNKLKNYLLLFIILSTGIVSKINGQITFTTAQYAEVLQKSMFFYRAQQSGKLPSFNKINWRGDSGLNDGKDAGKDLTGGWYDAGDNVKFNFPMAYTATMLSWGAIQFKDGYVKAGQYEDLRNNLRFVCDYLIKCHTAPNELYGQVGDADVDHSFWGAAEVSEFALKTKRNLSNPRPSFKIDDSNPGSDLAMETASALAAASIVFKDDAGYSGTLLKHAKELYDFGNNFRGKYSDVIKKASPYYTSYSSYEDDLVWGSLWLYQATNENKYLVNAEDFYKSTKLNEGGSSIKKYTECLSWDDKVNGCEVLLAKLTGKANYIEDAERHLDYWADKKGKFSPGGMAYIFQWAPLRYAANLSFTALYYSDVTTNATKKAKYVDLARNQTNYALGNNPAKRSYVLGFGVNPPKKAHHRTESGIWDDNINSAFDNRHTLYGALVGGPGIDDVYIDERSQYTYTEVAVDYNAAFSGVLARFVMDGSAITLPAIPVEKVGDEYFTTVKSNASGADFLEVSVRTHNRTAWPARIPTKLSYRYFIDITEGLAKNYSATDYKIVKGYSPDAILASPNLIKWSNNIYYVEVVYNDPLKPIYPGGQGESQRESQIRITGPNGAWNPSNDFSSTGISSTETKTEYIAVYENGVKVYGNEPAGGLSTSDFDQYILNNISIYPIPSSGDLTINFPENIDIKNIVISDLSGREIFSQKIITVKNDYKMNISNLPLGLYSISFKSDENIWTKKIIKN